MKLMTSNFKQMIKLARYSDKICNYKIADYIVNSLVKTAQDQTLQAGQDLNPNTQYVVPTSTPDVFNQVAETAKPQRAIVGGEQVLITHGSADGTYIIDDNGANQFFSNNPDFKTNNTLGDVDSGAGIEASYEPNLNRLWLNAQGMQKYAGPRWMSCFDAIDGKGFGQYATSKKEIEVGTRTGPQGQETIIQTK